MELVRNVHQIGAHVGGSRLAPNGGCGCDRRDVFHTTFDPTIESSLTVVTEAVQIVQDRTTDELDPLAEVVDVDAFRCLLEESTTTVEIQFDYEGLTLTIDSDGNLWLERR